MSLRKEITFKSYSEQLTCGGMVPEDTNPGGEKNLILNISAMKDIYEFIYLYIHNITTDNGEKKSTGSALFAFTALLTSNVLFPVIVFLVFSDQTINLKWFIISFYLGLSVINYFLFVFYDKSLTEIKLRWEKKTEESKTLWKRNIYRYIMASIILFVLPITLKIIMRFS